ncbi:MAG: DUF2164 domain-containing protein [Candidatus Cohnella colombiensis]|uniref:DUF2164 domain-containing protein n=1 Tax=Candidatus Cohnella colombiensis TaxID=3121368 RepID=A0AA95F6Q4_9BACL|nr:MAG: DUF2164 domain-containing protein [Cohnella sp.]
MITPIKLPREDKEQIIDKVQAYFEEERSETLGNLAAEQLIDFMIQVIGPYLYNKAISDARVLITEKINQIDDELYAIEKPLQSRGRR